ncbi:zinc carboxypeptidase [Scopulibacillus darangshiensis]|uniref:Zinc carboxypeptidase n=1 Tax=Scopulibacillus darangshiensis TaxID=442528 RepID=A0A4V2SL22_9BACL|nr:M14 family metallocarboxypeptidase [Scopulibacillus darangshiensis]TCP21726.1 zinc carboxypeptidase [Scopulibacillus darangshiensis]
MFKKKVLALVALTVMIFSLMFGAGQLSLASTNSNQPDKTPSAREKAAPPAAGQTNSSFTPFFGQDYEQPEQVKALYPEPDVDFDTPGFKAGKWNFTTQKEMMRFIKELQSSSDVMKVKTAGKSLEGRKLPLLIFTTSKNENSMDFKRKPTVWLEGQIHGNEPAGGESVLVTAEKLAKGDLGKEVLDKINVIVMPRMNPDGSYYFQRRTANQLDANRDHVKLELPEIRAAHKAFNKYNPEVVIDAHEYGATPAFPDIGEKGAVKYHDILLLSGKNLNIPKSIRTKSDNWFLKNAFKNLDKHGYSSSTYYTVRHSSGGEPTLYEGGGDARIGRNAYGLQPSFSFLIESRGIGIGRENFKRRVASQVVAQTSILKTAAERAGEVKAAVNGARSEIVRKGKSVNNNDKIVLQSAFKEMKGKKQKVVDIAKGEVVDIPVKYYSSKKAEPTLERVRPKAYIMPPAYHDIADKLRNQGVEVKRLKEAKELTVETYKVTDTEFDDQYYEGHLLNHVKTNVKEKKVFFPKGSYVYSMAQPAANLTALALEPESGDSYVTFNYLPVNVGDEVPVYRYMDDKPLVD